MQITDIVIYYPITILNLGGEHMQIMNITLHTLIPYNHQYPRTTNPVQNSKKDDSEKKLSFQQILNEKMTK